MAGFASFAGVESVAEGAGVPLGEAEGAVPGELSQPRTPWDATQRSAITERYCMARDQSMSCIRCQVDHAHKRR
jgi:hypothetical protein